MKHKILLVDDEADSLDSMRDLLEGEFRVLCAEPADPVRSARALWGEHFDLRLAILDLHMPDAPGGQSRLQSEEVGFGLAADLKAARPRSRIAIRSGYETHQNLARAIVEGADAFIGKGWDRGSVLANVHFLHVWTTAGATFRALSQGIDYRVPDSAGHGQRVRELCRAILLHLTDANSKNFDLAGCMVAAELHDLGKLAVPDEILRSTEAGRSPEARAVLERHIRFAALLRDLGPGFDRVAQIVFLHHRCYAEPRSACLPDYPADASLPRGDDIPFETRVLRAADVLDTLLTGRPALSLDEAVRFMGLQTERGVFDPRVTTALERLVQIERDRLDQLYAAVWAPGLAELALYFNDRRLTAGRLRACLEVLAGIYLPAGRASDRLAVLGVERGDFDGGATVKVRLAGTEEDIDAAQQALERRMAGHREGLPLEQGPLPSRLVRAAAR